MPMGLGPMYTCSWFLDTECHCVKDRKIRITSTRPEFISASTCLFFSLPTYRVKFHLLDASNVSVTQHFLKCAVSSFLVGDCVRHCCNRLVQWAHTHSQLDHSPPTLESISWFIYTSQHLGQDQEIKNYISVLITTNLKWMQISEGQDKVPFWHNYSGEKTSEIHMNSPSKISHLQYDDSSDSKCTFKQDIICMFLIFGE